MLRKFLLAAAVVSGLVLGGTQTADAGWRRAYYGGYYGGPAYYGRAYYPRRFYRRRFYAAPVVNYGYGTAGYYNYPAYYGGYGYYGPGVGVQVGPGFGFYAW